MKLQKTYHTFLAIFVFLITQQSSCDKKRIQYNIPDVYVNFSIIPGSIQFEHLNIVGNSSYVTGGYRGIIVYHATPNEYRAYERTPPHNFPNDKSCIIKIENNGLAVDSCSNSRYILLDGSPFDGPATLPLLQYNTDFDGVQLHIFN